MESCAYISSLFGDEENGTIQSVFCVKSTSVANSQSLTEYLLEVKFEVELPCACILGHIAIFVRKSNAKLDHLKQIHVASKCLVVVVGRCPKVAYVYYISTELF